MDATPSLMFPNRPINPRPSMMDRVRSRLFGTHPPGETGEQNAQRFVQTVATLAKDERVILMYPTYTKASYVGGWVWMMNAAWRARVLDLLKAAPVKDAQFHEPDSLDGWTFSAYSTVPVPRIAQLTLDQSL